MTFEYGSCDGTCDVDLITKKKRKAYKYMNDIELYLLKRWVFDQINTFVLFVQMCVVVMTHFEAIRACG